MKPRIDTLYIYQQQDGSMMAERFRKINKRVQKDFRFLRHNIPDMADEVCRYALTVSINGDDRTLLLITLETSPRKIKKFFNNAVKQITGDPDLIKKYKSAKSKPVQMDIAYAD